MSNNLDVHEEFVGLHVVDSIDANTPVVVIKDVLLRFNLADQNTWPMLYRLFWTYIEFGLW